MIVFAAFVGAFSARWIDQSLSYNFPVNLLGLLFSGILLFFIARWFLKDYYRN